MTCGSGRTGASSRSSAPPVPRFPSGFTGQSPTCSQPPRWGHGAVCWERGCWWSQPGIQEGVGPWGTSGLAAAAAGRGEHGKGNFCVGFVGVLVPQLGQGQCPSLQALLDVLGTALLHHWAPWGAGWAQQGFLFAELTLGFPFLSPLLQPHDIRAQVSDARAPLGAVPLSCPLPCG